MKHIFVVHSPITYLSALGVVLLEEIEKKDVLIISESFRLDYEPIPIVQVSSMKSFSLLKKRSFKIYNEIDTIIDKFSSDDKFIAYIPVFHLLDRYLITHPLCLKFNFIEEGFASYYKYYRGIQHAYIAGYKWRYSKGIKGIKERYINIINIIKGISPSILALPTFYTAYASDPNIIFYGFHEKSHYLGVNRKILSFNSIIDHYKLKTKYNLNNTTIWIGDPDVISLIGNTTELYDSLKKSFINYLQNNNISSIYIRFHYREINEQKKQFIDFFNQNNIMVIEIEQDTILEVELIKAKNVTLVGIFSSLLVYGGIMGHTSLSIYNYLPLSFKKVSNASNDQLDIFWNFVDKL